MRTRALRRSRRIIERSTRQVNRRVTRALGAALALVASAAFAAPRHAVAVFPSGAEFALVIAQSAEERARGYMFRESVGPREGMLFLFDEPGRHSFWMKNCRVALDIIWLDDAYRVVHVAPAQAPCPEAGACPPIVPLRPARYVLEVASGMAQAERLELGSTVVILAEPALR
jgi:uncharacterized membrane protein (UPF0127 family)